jgi:hypothetical protein
MLHPPSRSARLTRDRPTAKEAAILGLLCGSGRHAVEWQILMQRARVCDGAPARLPAASHIDRLRQRIERDPRRPALLLTMNGGCRLGLALA